MLKRSDAPTPQTNSKSASKLTHLSVCHHSLFLCFFVCCMHNGNTKQKFKKLGVSQALKINKTIPHSSHRSNPEVGAKLQLVEVPQQIYIYITLPCQLHAQSCDLSLSSAERNSNFTCTLKLYPVAFMT